jgi:hypothetical protein
MTLTDKSGVDAANAPAPQEPRRRRWWRPPHALFLLVLGGGVLLRVLAQLAYDPAILYYDSFRYLGNLEALYPANLNPIGYELLVLKPLLTIGDLSLVTAVQHLAVLGSAIAFYVLLLRHGVRRWIAALATAPLLLDAYQVQIEQNIMAEALFQLLLVGALWTLTSAGAPSPRRSALAGVLLGVLVMVRLVAVTLAVPALVYLLLAGGAWRRRAEYRLVLRRVAALLAGLAVVMTTYGSFFFLHTGRFGISGTSGNVLYGRTATVADCEALPLTDAQRELCPVEPLGEREGVDHYAHAFSAEVAVAEPEQVEAFRGLQREFAYTVLLHQPFDIASAVLTDFLKGFAWNRTTSDGDVPVERWLFPRTYPYYEPPEMVDAFALEFGGTEPSVDPTLTHVLRGYQTTVGWTPGPLLAAAGLLGFAAAFGLGRARRSGLRAVCLLAAGAGLTILLTSAAFEFSWRYQLPGLVLLPLAGALGLTALLSGGIIPRRPLLDAFPDEVDAASAGQFRGRYGQVDLAPVVLVIAAYNEVNGLPAVLDSVPARYRDLPIDVLVVVDGGQDGTAQVALGHGRAYACVAPVNRGQGAALRLGYNLARDHGARWVVTTDADGQYDMSELGELLDPLLDDEADFVTGSRRLGQEDTTDPVRRLGVRVFAVLASVLARKWITDTSFGFRAMRADAACSVSLRQPQYQSSELLVGVLLHGYRVLERPMTMRDRSAGQSKKGSNFVYGASYAQVLLGTWWRGRRRGPAAGRQGAREPVRAAD